MKNRFIYLETCNTCQRIKEELDLPESIVLQNTKDEPINADQLEYLREQSGSYESLFNRRAQLYRKRGLHEQNLTEDDYKKLLLDHYTFIKRPILIYNGKTFIGNSKKTVAAAQQALNHD